MNRTCVDCASPLVRPAHGSISARCAACRLARLRSRQADIDDTVLPATLITEAHGACPWCSVGNHELCSPTGCICCGTPEP
jgi:hypothetical protein